MDAHVVSVEDWLIVVSGVEECFEGDRGVPVVYLWCLITCQPDGCGFRF